jgi:Trk K+ transport system NAD-binding subunit
MTLSSSDHLRRQIRASLRDTWLLFREFKWPLLAFVGSVFFGGISYHLLGRTAGEPIASLAESTYHVLGLVFLSPIEAFPSAWYLQIFYFVMPVIGIGSLAQGVADFGVLFFNRRARGKEWEMAVASTFSEHVVLIGLGHLGYRVAHQLHALGEDVVVIDLNPNPDFRASVQAVGIPVLADDSTREAALNAAGVPKAHAIVLCTQNDSLNLQVAMKARSLNPEIEVVVRIFDDDFAHALKDQFGFHALSTSATSSPLFAAAAAGVDMTRPITIEGQALCLARLSITAKSGLARLSVENIERDYDVSVVLLRRAPEATDFHPGAERRVQPGDWLAVLGDTQAISNVIQENEARSRGKTN